MSKSRTLRAIDHSKQVIALVNQLKQLRLLVVDSPARIRIMPDVLPADTKRRDTILRNLWIYARISEQLSEHHLLEIIDLETELPIATLSGTTITIDPTYVFT